LPVRLPPHIERRLEELACKTGRSKTFYVRAAIFRHLNDLEDYHLAARRLKKNPLASLWRRSSAVLAWRIVWRDYHPQAAANFKIQSTADGSACVVKSMPEGWGSVYP
jgi:RHH-type rel operon transcriptional repressor/antitoxin RelB